MNQQTKRSFFLRPRYGFYHFFLLTCLTLSNATLLAEVPNEDTFSALKLKMKQDNIPLLLEFSASYCHYCKTLETDYLIPMLDDEQFEKRVIIRKIEIDSDKEIEDFLGNKINVTDFAGQYNIIVTPTLLFLDDRGEEIAERLIGMGISEMFYGYLLNGINQANKHLNSKD